MASTKVILYSYWRSSCAWRVRTALSIKGIEYEYRAVHLVKDGGQQHGDEYKSLNPTELVPTLVIQRPDQPDIVLTQSVAILEFLEESDLWKDRQSLLPSDPQERAKVRSFVQTIASDTQPLQNLRVITHPLIADHKSEWVCHWVGRSFAALEKGLEVSSGRFCFGDVLSLADVCLVPQVFAARRFGLDLSPFPLISRIEQELLSLPEFSRAIPSAQPDAEVA